MFEVICTARVSDVHTPDKYNRCLMVAACVLLTRCQCPPVTLSLVKSHCSLPDGRICQVFTRCLCSPVFARFRLLPCQNHREEDPGRLILSCQFRKSRARSPRNASGPPRHPTHYMDSARTCSKPAPLITLTSDYGPQKVYFASFRQNFHLFYASIEFGVSDHELTMVSSCRHFTPAKSNLARLNFCHIQRAPALHQFYSSLFSCRFQYL